MFCFAQPRTRDNVRIPKKLLSELRLFQERPDLVAAGRYAITSAVDPEVVDLFFGRVGGDTEKVVTAENAEQLRALCDELGFSGFDDEIRAVLGGNWEARKDLVCLRDRVDRHDVLLEELHRRVLELDRQLREQRAVVQRVEAVERRVEEIRDLDVRGRGEVAKSVDARVESVSRLRDEVSALKGSESQLRSDLGDVSLLLRATIKTCLFSWVRETEAKLGRKMVVVRKSSGDIYGWLDPDSSDSYGLDNIPGAWIEIEFKAPVRVNGLKITSSNWGHYPKTFDVTFSDGPGSDAKRKVSFVDEKGLNGDNRSVERKFYAVTAKLVRIESRGPNWDGKNFFNLGGFELFSPDEAHAGGVFRSIFARDRDRVWDCFDVRARDFDGSELHIANNGNTSTFPGEHEWVEVGFLHGRVVLSGYRIQKHQECLRGWSLRASNDRNAPLEEWRVLHRHREATEAEKTSKVLTFECACPTPFRFFRVVQEEKRWTGDLHLSIKYFDVDGAFLPD